MNINSKLTIGAIGLCGYLMIKEVVRLDRRSKEMDKIEEELVGKLNAAKYGIDIDEVIDVDFE